MLKRSWIVLVLFAGLIACKSKSGFKYSQDIVAKERSLEPAFQDGQTRITAYATVGNYDSVIIVAKSLEAKVQNTIDEIEKMPKPNAKGVDDFKSAIMKYFGYMKSIWTSYRKWAEAPTEEERQAELNNVTKIEGERFEVVREMQTAQRKYADQNGFKVEK